MKRIRKKVLILILAMTVCLTAGSVLPTFSWLSAESDTVVNTFSGGAISLILDEAKVDGNGQATDGERVTENNYRITPGAVLDKDPAVTVLAGSDSCYVFLYMENTLPEQYFTLDYSSEWIRAASSENGSLFVYQNIVDAGAENVKLPPLFTTVTISGELTDEMIAGLGERTLKVQAYAVQSEGISSTDALLMAEEYFQSQADLSGFTDIRDTAVPDMLSEPEETDIEGTLGNDAAEASDGEVESEKTDSASAGTTAEKSETVQNEAEDTEETAGENTEIDESSQNKTENDVTVPAEENNVSSGSQDEQTSAEPSDTSGTGGEETP